MQLIEVPYRYVAKHAHRAARERVSVSDTKNTRWFRTPGHEGFCGILRLPNGGHRVKGVFVSPEWRGMGIGEAMTDALLAIAEASGNRRVEVLAYNAKFYEERGFVRVRQLPNGAWRLNRE